MGKIKKGDKVRALTEILQAAGLEGVTEKQVKELLSEEVTACNKLDLKKKLFISAYIANLGNITTSCHSIGITRTTYWRWCKNDPYFTEAIKNIEVDEIKKDFYRRCLDEKAALGDTTAIIYGMKTLGIGFTGMKENAPPAEDSDDEGVLYYLPVNGREIEDVSHTELKENEQGQIDNDNR